MSETVAEIKDLYEQGRWKGLEQWRCKACPFDTLSGERAIVEHIVAAHFPPPPTPEPPQVLVADRFGNVVEPLLSEGEATAEVRDVSEMTVDQVLAAVDAGEISAAEALIAEQAGRRRSTLIEALEARE